MLLSTILLLYYVIKGLVRESTSVYIGGANSRMRNKLVALDKDLTLDAITNVRRIQHFTSELYEQHDAFHIGKLLVKIRGKFGRMVRIHALSYNNFEEYDINKHILHLAEVQHLAMDIDNLVQVILDFEWEGKPKKPPVRGLDRYITLTSPLPNSTAKAPKMLLRYQAKKSINNFVAAPRFKANVLRKSAKNIENNGGGFDSDINK